MSVNITTAFVQQFKDNIHVLAQQKGSRLRDCVTLKPGVVGEYFWQEQMGSTAAVKNTTRHGDTPLVNSTHYKRRGTMFDFDWADLVDEEDKVRMLIDPTSTYAQNAAFAMGRAIDDEIIAAFSATVQGGKDGLTSYQFGYNPETGAVYNPWGVSGAGDGGYQMIIPAEAGASGYTHETPGTTHTNLSLQKLIFTKEILDKYENDPDDPRYFICTSAQLGSLLRQQKVTSSDYAQIKALVTGQVDTYMGFKFVRTERLTVASSIRQCWAFCKSAMVLAIGKDMTTRIEPRVDKRYSMQVYVKQTLGSVRMFEGGVVRVDCDETIVNET